MKTEKEIQAVLISLRSQGYENEVVEFKEAKHQIRI